MTPKYKLVPIEPTQEMIDEGRTASTHPRERYKAMLAAAPEVETLVETLVEALEEIAAFQPKDILCGSGWKEWNRAGEYAASIARNALAAHRKQGGE